MGELPSFWSDVENAKTLFPTNVVYTTHDWHDTIDAVRAIGIAHLNWITKNLKMHIRCFKGILPSHFFLISRLDSHFRPTTLSRRSSQAQFRPYRLTLSSWTVFVRQTPTPNEYSTRFSKPAFCLCTALFWQQTREQWETTVQNNVQYSWKTQNVKLLQHVRSNAEAIGYGTNAIWVRKVEGKCRKLHFQFPFLLHFPFDLSNSLALEAIVFPNPLAVTCHVLTVIAAACKIFNEKNLFNLAGNARKKLTKKWLVIYYSPSLCGRLAFLM